MSRHLPLARQVADRLAAGVPKYVDPRDLAQDGVLGLIAAAADFRPEFGVAFRTYAKLRIKGAIREGIRARDPIPRVARTRAREVEAADQAFAAGAGRPPSAAELRDAVERRAAVLGHHLILNDPARTLADARLGNTPEARSLSSPFRDGGCGGGGGGVAVDRPARVSDTIADPAADPAAPAARVQAAEIRKALHDACFSRAERVLLDAYFFANCSLKECGRAIGFSESRCSQMMTALLPRLANCAALRRLAGVAPDAPPDAPLRFLHAGDVRALIHGDFGRPITCKQARRTLQGRVARRRQGRRPHGRGTGARGGEEAPARPAQDGPSPLSINTQITLKPGPPNPRKEPGRLTA